MGIITTSRIGRNYTTCRQRGASITIVEYTTYKRSIVLLAVVYYIDNVVEDDYSNDDRSILPIVTSSIHSLQGSVQGHSWEWNEQVSSATVYCSHENEC
jgi:hypothetical protein